MCYTKVRSNNKKSPEDEWFVSVREGNFVRPPGGRHSRESAISCAISWYAHWARGRGRVSGKGRVVLGLKDVCGLAREPVVSSRSIYISLKRTSRLRTYRLTRNYYLRNDTR